MRRARPSASARSGACWTNCTSTTWRSLPAFRRGGVATALLRRVLGDGSKLGAVRATLEVRRSNDTARLLYERLGFSVVGVRRGYYTKPVEDAIVLWREELAADR